MANINPKTGIHFGCISADSLNPEVLHELLYGPNVIEHSYLEAQIEVIRETASRLDVNLPDFPEPAELGVSEFPEFIDFKLHADRIEDWMADCETMIQDRDATQDLDEKYESLEVQEPVVEGEYEGVHYGTSWLGGALHFIIVSSGYIGFAKPCSPCVPGAGDLGNVVYDDEVYNDDEALAEAWERQDAGEVVECYMVPKSWLLSEQTST